MTGNFDASIAFGTNLTRPAGAPRPITASARSGAGHRIAATRLPPTANLTAFRTTICGREESAVCSCQTTSRLPGCAASAMGRS